MHSPPHTHTHTCTHSYHREARLGYNGITDIKRHLFFKNNSWKWDNIRQCEPPVVPELKGDMDTTYFDVIDDEKDKTDSFAEPKVSSIAPSA